ncbi:hypothetical protein GDO81_027190 [Engystomops pustulosus]|uniref:Phospholipase A2 inhibitor and Ly6/PLAUR domain-containing protein-like n=2 Tax=Engystomops pustulosus TaxID=76066 RepID=A0AAV6YY00_ENGPU|nr:hypothetical protein GDO81_027190 [Engystomops pustulosus]
MIFSLLFVCVFSSLTTSHSLSCIECKDATDVPCTGDADTCDENEVCVSEFALTLIDGIPVVKLFMRGCGNQAQCFVSSSLSIPHARIISSSSCCYTDSCTPPRPVLPPITSKKNGLICKGCQSMEARPCDSDLYMECIGNETKCISQVAMSSGTPPTAIRGCATPSVCAVRHEEGTFGHLKFKSDITCTDGGAGLHYSLHLLGATFIFMFKVIN